MSYTEEEIRAMKIKADKWDKLEEQIAKFYDDDNNLDDDSDGGLLTIGEIAATAFGFL